MPRKENVDARDKPGHDGYRMAVSRREVHRGNAIGLVPAAVGSIPGGSRPKFHLAKNYFKPKMISQDGVAGRPRY
jgi:hypothetical protein